MNYNEKKSNIFNNPRSFYSIIIIFTHFLLEGANDRINFKGKDYFIFGINIGWLDGHYCWDFGFNEVYGWGPGYNSTHV